MTSQLVILRAFFSFFFRPHDPKSEKNPVNQLIKKFWPYYTQFVNTSICLLLCPSVISLQASLQSLDLLNILVKRKILLICIALLATVARGSSSIYCCFMIWASTRENLSSGFANNMGADQPALPHRLNSAFVIRLLKGTIPRLATSEISMF